MLAAWAPSWNRLTAVPHSGSEETKFSVPSMGSTTATHPSVRAVQPASSSSPTKVSSGRSDRSVSSRVCCTNRSAEVTGVSSSFRVTSVRSVSSRGISPSSTAWAFSSAERATAAVSFIPVSLLAPAQLFWSAWLPLHPAP